MSLAPYQAQRFSTRFSVGQRQGSASPPLAGEPQFIFATRRLPAPTSRPGAGLNLLSDLRERFVLTMLFMLARSRRRRYCCDRIVVLCLAGDGNRAGEGLYKAPKHPTQKRSSSIAAADRKLASPPLLRANPEPGRSAVGCVFRTRCPYALDACAARCPPCASIAGRFKDLHPRRISKDPMMNSTVLAEPSTPRPRAIRVAASRCRSPPSARSAGACLQAICRCRAR